LYLLRYESAVDQSQPPQVRVMRESGSEASVALILHPEAQDAVLERPGHCVVVRAVGEGRLTIEVRASAPNGSTNATVQLEPVRHGLSASARPLDLKELRILGHVSRRGDVEVGLGEWIAGPSNPLPIEGLELRWPGRSSQLDIRYAVRIGGPQPTPSKPVGPGTFVGTRGRALPLIGASFELGGSEAAGYQLVIDALFLGSPPVRTIGSKLNITGSTGREPLVGLRLTVETKPDIRARPTPATTSPGFPADGTRRVRVFRQGSEKLTS